MENTLIVSQLKKYYSVLYKKYLDLSFDYKTRGWVNREITNLFKGKRVIIIGPAETAVKYCNPEFVNSFDIVVRVNKSVPVTNDIAEFTTSRTDVLFHSLVETGFGNNGKFDWEIINQNEVKNLIFPLNYDLQYQVVLSQFDKKRYNVNFFQPSRKEYSSLQKMLSNYVPTTGLSSIYWCAKAKPSKLYITGFTFYQTNYSSGYRNEVGDIRQWIDRIKSEGKHSIANEFNIFCTLSNTYSFIETDPFLQELVKNQSKVLSTL